MKEGVLKRKALALLFLLILYFALRIPSYPCNPWGDEAWYFYISKRLKWNWDPHLPFLPPLRWAFMLLMHPFTQNIWTFRTAYMIYNSLALLALYLVARDWKTLLAAGLLLDLNSILINFSTTVFTSTMGATFMALSLATLDRLWISLPLSIIAVGAWEGVLFPFFAVALVKGVRKKRYLLFLIPVALALGMALDNKLYHKPLPGWAKGPLKLETLIGLFFPVGYFLPFMLPLEEIVIAMSMPLGLIAVNLIHHTYIQSWYLVATSTTFCLYFAKVKADWRYWAVWLIGTFLTLNLLHQALGLLYGPKDCCHLMIRDFIKVKRAGIVLYGEFWAYSEYPYGDVPNKYCLNLGCLHPAARRLGYVVSSTMLHVKWLKLIFHEGECYLFKYVGRSR